MELRFPPGSGLGDGGDRRVLSKRDVLGSEFNGGDAAT
jgi:hypothetical protein